MKHGEVRWWLSIPTNYDREPWHAVELPVYYVGEAPKILAERDKHRPHDHYAGGRKEGDGEVGILGEITTSLLCGYPSMEKIRNPLNYDRDLPGDGDVKSTGQWREPYLRVNVRAKGSFFVCVAVRLPDGDLFEPPAGAVVGWATRDDVFRETRKPEPSNWPGGAPYHKLHWMELRTWPALPPRPSRGEFIEAFRPSATEEDRLKAIETMRDAVARRGKLIWD